MNTDTGDLRLMDGQYIHYKQAATSAYLLVTALLSHWLHFLERPSTEILSSVFYVSPKRSSEARCSLGEMPFWRFCGEQLRTVMIRMVGIQIIVRRGIPGQFL